MNTPFSRMPGLRPPWIAVLGAIALLPWGASLRATVTLEVYFNNDGLPAGALAALVADVAGDGFLDLSDLSVSGTALVPGSTFGGGDDRILAVITATGGPEWVNGSGIGETIAGLDYAAHGIAEGTALALVVFPDLRSGDSFLLGDRYAVYRNISPGGSGGDIPFEAPADGGVYTLAAITPVDGGDFEPAAPEPGETYKTGNAGGGGDGLPDDHGNSRQDATAVEGGAFSGEIAPGDLDFFEFTLDGLSLLRARGTGGVPVEGWLFDEAGNLLSTPGGGPFGLERILAAGTYRIGLRGQGNAQTGNYSFDLDSKALPDRRPDLTIGGPGGGQKGRDRYSTSGAGQQVRVISKAGRRVRVAFTVGNDAGLDSVIGFQASRGNRFVKTTYLRTSGGTLNVTGLAVTRGYLEDYAPLSSRSYLADFSPTPSGKRSGKRVGFLLNAKAGSLLDRGIINLSID